MNKVLIQATEVILPCTICGRETIWDTSLGDKVKCVECWDRLSGIENEVAARRRRYYEEHKAEVAGYQRRYYEEHKAEVAG